MHPIPREKLRQLVLRFGKELGQDSRRCEALLRDVCGSYRKEIFALASAVREGIPGELSSISADIPLKAVFGKFTQRLHENLGISEDLCQWTVESWAYALGVVTKKDLLPVARCPSCDAGMKIPGKLYGKQSKCPRCGTGLLISEDGKPTLRTGDTSGSQSHAASSSKSGDRHPRAAAPSQAVAKGTAQISSQLADDIIEAEIVAPSSETTEQVFRQVVWRAICADGGLKQTHYRDLENARASLGLPFEAAQSIALELATLYESHGAAAGVSAPSLQGSLAGAAFTPNVLPLGAQAISVAPLQYAAFKTQRQKWPRARLPGICLFASGLLTLGCGVWSLIDAFGKQNPPHDLVVISIVWVGLGVAAAIGGFSAISTNYYILAVFGAFAGLLGTLSCCGPINLPVGLWAISVFLDPEVRRTFRT